MASGTINDDAGENDGNLRLSRGGRRARLKGENKSTEIMSKSRGLFHKAGEAVVPLSSPQQQTEQILKKCALEVRGDHWIVLRDLVIKYRDAFPLDDYKLRSTDVVENRIETCNSKAINVPHTEPHLLGYQPSRKKLEKC